MARLRPIHVFDGHGMRTRFGPGGTAARLVGGRVAGWRPHPDVAA